MSTDCLKSGAETALSSGEQLARPGISQVQLTDG
ncbi:hypothetical protein ACVWZX_002232 [Deinococcus sp. UYEF24]